MMESKGTPSFFKLRATSTIPFNFPSTKPSARPSTLPQRPRDYKSRALAN